LQDHQSKKKKGTRPEPSVWLALWLALAFGTAAIAATLIAIITKAGYGTTVGVGVLGCLFVVCFRTAYGQR
jgi:hypothetical protein